MGTTLADLINPFVKSGFQKLFAALKDGPKTGDDLVISYRVCKTVRQISNIVSGINRLHGVRVRAKGNPTDPKTMWEMYVVDPTSVLIRNKTAPMAPVTTEVEVEPSFKPSLPGKLGDYVVPPDYGYVKQAVEDGENVFLVGPTGSGKTVMALQIGQDLKAEVIRQNFDGETTVDNMVGYTEIGQEEGVSVTQWHDGELARAVKLAAKGERVIYVADEVTAGKPEILFKFHRVLELLKDGSREMEINGELIKVAPGKLSLIGTGNTFRSDETGMFQGTNTMNMAFSNRWTGGVFYVDYAPNEDEILVVHGISSPIARSLQEMAKAIRVKAKEENYPVVCSTRQLVGIGKRAMKWGCRRAVEYVYLNTLTADERKVVDPVVLATKFPVR